jgi:hypothetical protein
LQDFIKAYKAAYALKITKEQFANFWAGGVRPKSIDRKRQRVKKKIGLSLPVLLSDKNSSEIDLHTFGKFRELLDKDYKFFKSQNIQKKKKYVITSAQMSTPVNEGFLGCLENYCQENDAQLLVIPYRYTNPTSIWGSGNKNEYIAPSIEKYLLSEHVEITPMLHILGDVKVVATATQPIHGMDSLTGNASGIVGHPKVQLTTIPTPQKSLPKIMASTGSLTIPNYTISKAGKRAESHHSFSAIVVEIEDDNITFHIRHIKYNGKGIYDLNKFYQEKTVKDSKRIPILVTGDYHALFADENVNNATFKNKDSIVQTLNPENIIYHDLHDGYVRNTHSLNDDNLNYGKHHFGFNNIEEELQVTADLLDGFSHQDRKNIIVKSNHDEQIDRWLAHSDPKKDPENARFFHYMKFHQLSSVRKTKTGFSSFCPFEFWCKNPLDQKGLSSTENTVFLSRGDEFSYKGKLYHFHGDKGPNGARGSIKNLAKMGTPVVIGHSHSPNIYEGSFQVGLSARLDLDYAKDSPSSWLHSHAITYPDGNTTLIFVINGKWRA